MWYATWVENEINDTYLYNIIPVEYSITILRSSQFQKYPISNRGRSKKKKKMKKRALQRARITVFWLVRLLMYRNTRTDETRMISRKIGINDVCFKMYYMLCDVNRKRNKQHLPLFDIYFIPVECIRRDSGKTVHRKKSARPTPGVFRHEWLKRTRRSTRRCSATQTAHWGRAFCGLSGRTDGRTAYPIWIGRRHRRRREKGPATYVYIMLRAQPEKYKSVFGGGGRRFFLRWPC